MEANTAENTAPTESATPPQVEKTYTEGRDTAASTNGANGHARDDAPMSLSEYRQGLRDKREDAERKASAKAEFEAKSPEEQEAQRRKSINPIYWDEEIGEPNAPKPPADLDSEYQELKSKLDDLDPKDKAFAVGHLAELQRQRTETRRAEIKKSLEEMRMRHEMDAAQMQAHSNRAALIAEDLQSQLQQNFPEVFDQQSLWHLSQTDPERYAAYLAHHGHAQMIMAGIAQQQQAEQVQGFHESQWVSAQDYQIVRQIAHDRPDLIENGRLKPEVTRSIVKYAESVGVNQNELKAWYQQPANRDYRVQRMLLDASLYHAASQKAHAAKKAPLPEVVRPGTPEGGGIRHTDAEFAHLDSKSSLSIKQAAKLNQLRRARND